MRGWIRAATILSIAVAGAGLLAVGRVDPGTPSASADNQGVPHLHIDADPTNGTRPCDPIDATRTGAPTSGNYQVAVCLQEGMGSPDAFELRVIWSGGVATAPEVANSGDALADNPDFNDGAAPNGFGANWSCTAFGLAFPVADYPTTASETDARIVCNEKNFTAGTMTAEPGLLALITMTASGSGMETFEFGSDSNFNSPAFNNINCATVVCVGATVLQGAAPPTDTPTPGPTSTHTPTPLPTDTATPTFTPTSTSTPLPADDLDGDGVSNVQDNCPFTPNPSQINTPIGPIDNGPANSTDDVTVPNEDNAGDVCDVDRDNDGLHDLVELAGCGFGATDPGTTVLDDTYDDDGDGNPVPPLGSDNDGSDDGPSWDTDGDGVLDGVECTLGTNPNNPLLKPPAGATDANDDDGDGLLNGWEARGWGSNALLVDSDGDGLSDCREVGDVNGDGFANFPGDSITIATAAQVPGAVRSGVMDMNKDGVINFPGDAIFNARVAQVPGFCPPPEALPPNDVDGDGVVNDNDNCLTVFNPNQTNTPLPPLDNGPGIAGDDLTVPNDDLHGDACDPDRDNDGLTDIQEIQGCGFGFTDAGIPFDATYDDDHDGDPVPPMGDDVFDDGSSLDSDADGEHDGFECASGTNPNNPLSSTGGSIPDTDSDGDGLLDAWETRGWATDPSDIDSDDDGKGDCLEAVDVNGDGFVNFPGDTIATARAALDETFGNDATFDLNKDGFVNFPGDAVPSARRATGNVPCL